jgi:hypothetical protein
LIGYLPKTSMMPYIWGQIFEPLNALYFKTEGVDHFSNITRTSAGQNTRDNRRCFYYTEKTTAYFTPRCSCMATKSMHLCGYHQIARVLIHSSSSTIKLAMINITKIALIPFYITTILYYSGQQVVEISCTGKTNLYTQSNNP